jgi:putative transposase
MSANQACFPVAAMARVLSVSKAGYYAWAGRLPSARAKADAALLKRIRTVHLSSRETYGSPRVHALLRGLGERHSRKRIARLMREAGLAGASHRRGGPVTTRRDQEARPAPDLVDRNFAAEAPNQLWVADITFVPTAAGFLYLAVVLDAFSRRIVGWAMANHLRAELVLDALEMAVGQRRPREVIHHSDQGSQYTSLAFGKRCREAGVRPSPPRPPGRVPSRDRIIRLLADDGLGRRCLRQRHGRELLLDPGRRAAAAPPVQFASRGPHGLLQLHRGLVQLFIRTHISLCC